MITRGREEERGNNSLQIPIPTLEQDVVKYEVGKHRLGSDLDKALCEERSLTDS